MTESFPYRGRMGAMLLAAAAATSAQALLNHLGREEREESRACFPRA